MQSNIDLFSFGIQTISNLFIGPLHEKTCFRYIDGNTIPLLPKSGSVRLLIARWMVRSSPGARCCVLEQDTSSPLLSTG